MDYLLLVEGVSIRVLGPFTDADQQEVAARQIHDYLAEDGLVFWAEVEDNGILTVGDYSNGFFDGGAIC